MAPALKAFYDKRRVERLAAELARAWPAFPVDAFVADAARGLARMELMDRARHIAGAMARALPPAYPDALAIVLRALGPPLQGATGHGMAPFHFLPHTLFVAQRGLDHPDLSLDAQRGLTRRCSCEFSIRPFLERHPEATLRALEAWTGDADEHVRRLVSEGTRPRLPWAARLPRFQEDPAPVLRLLERLKDDPSEYVRRSVANNLNDVSKDHPALVVATCERWLQGASAARRRLVHHALRSLVRDGHADAIRLVGAQGGGAVTARASVEPRRARIGGSVRVHVELANGDARAATAVLALRVHFVKARGGTAPRSFRLRTTTLAPGGRAALAKTLSLRQHSTRTHHPGTHRVEVVVNGEPRAAARFEVVAGGKKKD
ncbi:MAG TPA: DNA alkylation repair protein [Candidatus Thermoplasmatota archaeon]|nr:DNA alkylation repair protein [Candidatus Thermoplasmatota archaeon]